MKVSKEDYQAVVKVFQERRKQLTEVLECNYPYNYHKQKATELQQLDELAARILPLLKN